jgi:hypothetical protein
MNLWDTRPDSRPAWPNIFRYLRDNDGGHHLPWPPKRSPGKTGCRGPTFFAGNATRFLIYWIHRFRSSWLRVRIERMSCHPPDPGDSRNQSYLGDDA